MTIQVSRRSTAHAKSKATLQAALNADAKSVWFHDPSIFASSRGDFNGANIKHGERFPVVMDPQTRSRFSEIVRKPDGTFVVR